MDPVCLSFHQQSCAGSLSRFPGLKKCRKPGSASLSRKASHFDEQLNGLVGAVGGGVVIAERPPGLGTYFLFVPATLPVGPLSRTPSWVPAVYGAPVPPGSDRHPLCPGRWV